MAFIPKHYIVLNKKASCWTRRRETKKKPAPAESVWVGDDPGECADIRSKLNREYRRRLGKINRTLKALRAKHPAPAFSGYFNQTVGELVTQRDNLRATVLKQILIQETK